MRNVTWELGYEHPDGRRNYKATLGRGFSVSIYDYGNGCVYYDFFLNGNAIEFIGSRGKVSSVQMAKSIVEDIWMNW